MSIFPPWFIPSGQNPKCESLSLTVGGGSTVNLEIPWIVGEKGTETTVNAHLVEADVRTSLPFRPFAYAHTLDVRTKRKPHSSCLLCLRS